MKTGPKNLRGSPRGAVVESIPNVKRVGSIRRIRAGLLGVFMGTANRCKALLAFVCLAIPCLAPAQSAAPEGRFRASGTGLVFPVPPGLVAHARPILADGDPRGGSLVVVDLAPEGVPPARAGLLAQVTITMRELPRAAVLRDLVEQPPGCAPEPFTEESAVVAGAPAVRRDSPSFRQYLVVRGRREYRFSAGPAEEHRKALAHVLDGLTFDDSPTGEAFPSADAAPLPQGAGVPEVRAVYLVPSNRVLEPGYRLGIEKAMRQVQAFYRSELGGRTFRLHDPVVEVVRTPHTVSWYQSQAPAADPVYRFWNGVTSDGFSLMGAQFNDPDDRWLFLIDADPLCGQVGGAGTQGVAVVPKNDSRNLLCESLVSACPGDQQFPGICVSTGGIGHEIGHAFNLPHPSPGSCPAPDTSCSSALMWTGYLAYPDAYFLDDDRTSLVNSPETAAFFSFFDPGPVPFSCGDGCAPPRPTNLAAGGGGPSVDLTWDASPGAESYSLYRRGPGSGGLYALAANGLPSNAHVDAVPGGQTYSYLVTAVSALGESGNSSPATATLPANVLSVADVTVVEGDSGTTEAAITISLSPSPRSRSRWAWPPRRERLRRDSTTKTPPAWSRFRRAPRARRSWCPSMATGSTRATRRSRFASTRRLAPPSAARWPPSPSRTTTSRGSPSTTSRSTKERWQCRPRSRSAWCLRTPRP